MIYKETLEYMKCENCGKEHKGNYGSGRFCSDKCARGFSTKDKRKEINKRVSNKLKGIKLSIETKEKMSKSLDKEEISKRMKELWKNPKFRKKIKIQDWTGKKHTEKAKEKMSQTRIKKILNGEILKFGKSIKCSYDFNNKKIKCDSKLEYVCLRYFNQNYNNIINIKRCDFSISYKDFENNDRNFIPDFIIETKEEMFIVECKYDKTNTKIRGKWKGYIENSPIKKKALKKFCKENNYKYFWFTNKTNKKYNKFKVPDSDRDEI